MAEPEEVMVRGVMVAVVLTVPVAPFPRPSTFGLGRNRNAIGRNRASGRERQFMMRDPLHRGTSDR